MKKKKAAPLTKQQKAANLQKNKDAANRNAAAVAENLNYQSNYYKQNAKALLEKKALRYKTDPKYRNSLLKAARDRHTNMQKAVRETSKKMESFVKSDAHRHISCCPTCGRPLPAPPKPKVLVVSKTYEVLMYSIGDLAKKLGRKSRTIAAWVKNGYLPDPAYKDVAMRRMWTHDQVLVIMHVCSLYRLRPPLDFVACGFVGKLKEELAKLGRLGIDVSMYTEPGDKRPGLLKRASMELFPDIHHNDDSSSPGQK